MGERPEIDRMIEEEAKNLAPEDRQNPDSPDLGKLISESLDMSKLPKDQSDQPVDKGIKPLTVAEFQSTKMQQRQAEADWEKEQEVRLELDHIPAPRLGVDAPPGNFEPSGLELADLASVPKAPPAERKPRPADEQMSDVLSMKKAAERPAMKSKKKRGLLSWLRGE